MGLELRQIQKLNLNMTQSLYQAISLLQYNNQELSQFLYQQSLENPLIDLSEPQPYTPGYGNQSLINRKQAKSTTEVIEEVTPSKVDFKDELIEQVHYLKIDTAIKQALLFLIDNLDERGYLTVSLQEVSESIHLQVDMCEQALHLLHNFEPYGVGARDLQECLLIQLRNQHVRDPLAERLIEDYFNVLVEGPEELSSYLDFSVDQIQNALQSIQKCRPTPVIVSQDPIQYIIPDASVVKKEGMYMAVMEDEWLPKFAVNADYYQQMQTTTSTDEAVRYITKKYQEARWLEHSLLHRKQTLEAVTQIMVQRQQRFLDNGIAFLVPLTLKDIASEIDVHESTVSRTIKNKFIQTPHGVLPYKQFFTKGIGNGANKTKSPEQIKALLQKIISEEKPTHPYSDQKIVAILQTNYHIRVSRRVIAKYRNECAIPSSSKRKQVK